MQRFVLLVGAVALVASGAAAFAQGMPMGGTMGGKAPTSRTAASMECSRQADAKGLHGTVRKHFRSRCMRDMARASRGERGLGYRQQGPAMRHGPSMAPGTH